MRGNDPYVLPGGDGLQNGARAPEMRVLADAGSHQDRCVTKHRHRSKPRTSASRSFRVRSTNGARSPTASPSCTSNPFSSTRSPCRERVRRKIPSATISRSSESPANRRNRRRTCCGRTNRPALSMDTALFMVLLIPNGIANVKCYRRSIVIRHRCQHLTTGAGVGRPLIALRVSTISRAQAASWR